MGTGIAAGGVIIYIAIVIIVFILCRYFILWYWKIDKIEEHLAVIRTVLSTQYQEALNAKSTGNGKPATPPKPSVDTFERSSSDK